MEQKYLWPIVGVVLGWALSAVSAGWKERLERRRLAARLLARLIHVYEELLVVQSSIEPLKTLSDSWKSYERLRQRVLDTYFLTSGSLNKLDSLIEEFAGYDPIEAVRLRGLMDHLAKHKAGKLTASADTETTYVLLLSAYEVGLDMCERGLTDALRRVSLRHGVVTAVKMRVFLWRKKPRKTTAAAIANKLVEDFKQGGAAAAERKANSEAVDIGLTTVSNGHS